MKIMEQSPTSSTTAASPHKLRLYNPPKPDSVLSFFTNHGFSISQTLNIVKRGPWLLSCDPHKSLLPKFQFLRSKGSSTSDIVHMVTLAPRNYNFDPSTSTFCIALLAKKTVKKENWDEKVDIFKRWGWSQEHVLLVFKRRPYCMLTSVDKINALMSFWVDQLGWNSLDLARAPGILSLSLPKRIVPRASVLQFLVYKGLLKKDASMVLPMLGTEKLFFEKFAGRFKEHFSHLLKLYEENMDLANKRESICL
ncbi:hypothetical protein RJT34_32215 [Clitoria ternatea]|uniref:Uncharacterized protein n=1 Tax=Clitoria ternatea TaxID=43366 RepID=A0AAN9EWI5_CLITE